MLVDEIAYDDGGAWPDTAGSSIALDPGSTDAGLNDAGSAWCHASSVLGNGNTDLGTPGLPNDACP